MKNIKERYASYSPEVQEAISLIISSLDDVESYVLTLDLLAINYDMMFNAIATIKNDGYDKEDFKGRTVKNHALTTFNQSQQTIIRLLNTFPTNPLAKAKIKKLDVLDENDSPIDEFIS